MFLTDAAKAVALDALFPTGTGTDRCYLSAHTAYSATGASLHGSKAAGAWAAASSGSKGTTAAIDISITAPVTISWIGAWGGTAGDTFRGMMPNGSTGFNSFQVDLTNNRIYCEGHGWANDQKITFYGGTPPTGLTAGTTYYVTGVGGRLRRVEHHRGCVLLERYAPRQQLHDPAVTEEIDMAQVRIEVDAGITVEVIEGAPSAAAIVALQAEVAARTAECAALAAKIAAAQAELTAAASADATEDAARDAAIAALS